MKSISEQIDELIAENGDSERDTINVLMARLDHANRSLALVDAEGLFVLRLYAALRAILELGKRDMTNPKYDGYFQEAGEVIAMIEGTPNRWQNPDDSEAVYQWACCNCSLPTPGKLWMTKAEVDEMGSCWHCGNEHFKRVA